MKIIVFNRTFILTVYSWDVAWCKICMWVGCQTQFKKQNPL